jgi:hypothetical protein
MAEKLIEFPALSEPVFKKILPIKPVHKKPPFPEVPLRQTNPQKKIPSKESSDRPGPKCSSNRGRPKRLKVLNLTFTVLFMNDAQMAARNRKQH